MNGNANLKGALLMTASMGSFTLNDVFVKLLAEDMPLFQIVFLRSVLTVILMVIAAAALGQLRLRPGPGDRARLAWRTAFEIATMVAFLYALTNMPIANATAILAALPLSVTVAAAVFLGEPLGWRRLSAVIVGFTGVMLIVQPGTDGFNAFSLSALLAVGFITGRDLVTRRMGPGLPSLGVAVVTAAGGRGLFPDPQPVRDLGADRPAGGGFHLIHRRLHHRRLPFLDHGDAGGGCGRGRAFPLLGPGLRADASGSSSSRNGRTRLPCSARAWSSGRGSTRSCANGPSPRG
jgi:drug/metabolite transporter (DMT)-like permease